MKKVIYHLKKYKLQLIVGPAFKLLEAILELMIPTLMAKVIDVGVETRDSGYIFRMGGLMLLIAAIGLLSALICQYSASIASQGFGTDLRNTLYRHILSLSSQETDKVGTTAYTTRISNDVNSLQTAVAMLIRLVIRAPFISIGSIVMALTINARLSLVIIFSLPILTFIIYVIMKKTIPLYQNALKHLDKLTLILKENLSGVRVIRAFARREKEKERFDDENTAFSDFSIKAGRISTMLNPATTVIMNIAIVLILWFSGVSINKGNMTQGEIIAFINYISYMVAALLVTANLVILFTRAYASALRVAEVLEQESSIKDGEIEQIQDDPYAVEFDDVYFAYNDDLYVLSDISIRIKKGESLGIIGGTGSGKTTLVNLILRNYDTNKGQVKLFGLNVRDYKLKTIRDSIALVAQKNVIFSGTFKENILQGKPDATTEDITLAAKNAQALDFIEKKNDGFDHVIERGGANLSGGQKQRLSIARALVRKPKILILDDSLSALDYETDTKLRKALSGYDMTKIIVSQRIISVKNCDNILVLDSGRIIGYGNHSKLYEECQVYRELCVTQLNGDNNG